MESHAQSVVTEPRPEVRRREPRWLTVADLCVIVAGVALVLANWSPWLPFGAPMPLVALALFGLFRLTVELGVLLALVVLGRRFRYGGPVRSSEWLALGLASLAVVNLVPDLDGAVNAYYAAAGSTALDFGVACWLLSAPATAGVVLVAAGLVVARRRSREGSRVAAALTVVGAVVGLTLWFWGPCAIARLQLPWLLVPSPTGDPTSWGFSGTVVAALRAVVATAPAALAWGLLAAATVRGWRADRSGGPSRAWVWTEPAARADGALAAVLFAVKSQLDPREPAEIAGGVASVIALGLVSWWVTGRLGAGGLPAARARALSDPSRKERSLP
jgi:hypothetical protein